MKIPVIHPEYYMSSRGKRVPRLIIKTMMEHPNNNGALESYTTQGLKPESLIFQSDILWPSIYQNKKIYAVGKDFFSAIASVENDLPMDILPDTFTAYIACPNQDVIRLYNTVQKIFDPVVGFYVTFIKRQNRVGMAIFPHVGDDDENGNPTLDAAPVAGELKITLDAKNGKVQMQGSEFPEKVAKTLSYVTLNLIAYINSSQPDITWMKPKASMGAKERKEHLAKGHYTSSTLSVPIRLISWGWMKPRQYTTAEWTRKMHLRWQRFGKNNSEVKLIWIAATVAQRRRTTGEDE